MSPKNDTIGELPTPRDVPYNLHISSEQSAAPQLKQLHACDRSSSAIGDHAGGAQGRHGIKMKLTFVCVLAMAMVLSQMSSTSIANLIRVSGGEIRYDGK